jgi:hypothetical protein
MIQWRKSTYSQGGGQGECVEISTNTGDATLIRDSKNPEGAHIALTQSEFTQLVHTIKGGGYKV